MRASAVDWLSATTDQWGQPSANTDPAEVRRGVAAGETWMIDRALHPVATITVNGRTDPGLWTPEEVRTGLFVHRLIVDREAAGEQLGAYLLDYAGRLAQADGLDWLRLDCWTTNHGLHAYYLRQGFTHVRTVEEADTPSAALFQRPSATHGPRHRPRARTLAS